MSSSVCAPVCVFTLRDYRKVSALLDLELKVVVHVLACQEPNSGPQEALLISEPSL